MAIAKIANMVGRLRSHLGALRGLISEPLDLTIRLPPSSCERYRLEKKKNNFFYCWRSRNGLRRRRFFVLILNI